MELLQIIIQRGIFNKSPPLLLYLIHDNTKKQPSVIEFVENAPIKGIKIKYGIYKNIDKNLSIATIYDYASMAAETVMEDYNHDYAYYTDELAQKRLYNQMIENDFTDALKNKERLV